MFMGHFKFKDYLLLTKNNTGILKIIPCMNREYIPTGSHPVWFFNKKQIGFKFKLTTGDMNKRFRQLGRIIIIFRLKIKHSY